MRKLLALLLIGAGVFVASSIEARAGRHGWNNGCYGCYGCYGCACHRPRRTRSGAPGQDLGIAIPVVYQTQVAPPVAPPAPPMTPAVPETPPEGAVQATPHPVQPVAPSCAAPAYPPCNYGSCGVVAPCYYHQIPYCYSSCYSNYCGCYGRRGR